MLEFCILCILSYIELAVSHSTGLFRIGKLTMFFSDMSVMLSIIKDTLTCIGCPTNRKKRLQHHQNLEASSQKSAMGGCYGGLGADL